MVEQKGENELILEVDRVRYFYEFKTPEFLEVIEEITMVNKSEETITEMDYELREFRSALQIIDSDGEMLEFHGTESENTNEITIELPKCKGIHPQKYRTIRLKYVQYLKLKPEQNIIVIKIFHHLRSTSYIFVRPSKRYDFRVTYSEELRKKYPEMKTNKSRHFFDIYLPSTDKYEYEEIKLRVLHELPDSFKLWYWLGASFGSIWLLFVCSFLYTSINITSINIDNLVNYVVVGIMVMTILIIIRSWLFFENMHKHLGKFDKIYQAIFYANVLTITVIMMLVLMQKL